MTQETQTQNKVTVSSWNGVPFAILYILEKVFTFFTHEEGLEILGTQFMGDPSEDISVSEYQRLYKLIKEAQISATITRVTENAALSYKSTLVELYNGGIEGADLSMLTQAAKYNANRALLS